MRRKSDALHADRWLLSRRLESLGLRKVAGIEVHENRSVMVSVTCNGVLRMHRGYAYASDEVLLAIITFVTPRSGSDAVRRAKRTLLGFSAAAYSQLKPSRRKAAIARNRPEDSADLARLRALHSDLNALHFRSVLSLIPIRISGRMKRRLGDITLDSKSRPRVITVSRFHIAQDGWDQVRVTLLHEMVHQWQAETGLPVDHGRKFRKKATEVGIPPAATRGVG